MSNQFATTQRTVVLQARDGTDSRTHAEACYRLEPADMVTPELVFERRWGLTLMEQPRSMTNAVTS
jgi:hypothetical protein